MAVYTTKTYNFNPTAAEILLDAFQRCGVRPTSLTRTHLQFGEQSENFVLSEISNLQPNLWEVGLRAIPLLQGVATYSLPAETVQILDLFISFGSGPTDRYLMGLSRTEYAALPNKSQQGTPSQYWFNRVVSPTITFYFVPDGNGPYVAKYYSSRQTQDVALVNGNTVEIPYRWLETFTAGTAWKLAEKYAPQLKADLFNEYQRQIALAMKEDQENVNLMIVPGVAGYWR